MMTLKLLPTPQAFDATDCPSGDRKKRKQKGGCANLREIFNQESTSSPQESPVNQPQLPGIGRGNLTIDGSGQRLLESLGKLNQPGASLKMCRDYLLLTTAWHSRIVALHWKMKVTKCNRLLFQLAPSMPRTGETGYGLLLTPSVMEMSTGGTGEKFVTSTGTIRRKNKNGTTSNLGLSHQIAMLPTPTRQCYKSEKCSDEAFNRKTRPLSETFGKKTGLKLQPAFVEWMMGYPEGWTD